MADEVIDSIPDKVEKKKSSISIKIMIISLIIFILLTVYLYFFGTNLINSVTKP